MNLDLFCTDNERVIYRKIRYIKFKLNLLSIEQNREVN